MMKSLGHTVVLYGGPNTEAMCDRYVPLVSREEQESLWNGNGYIRPIWDSNHSVWKGYNERVAKAIKEDKKEGDFVCILGGSAHCDLIDALPDLKVVEYGIGYSGYASKWLIFESHQWRAFCMGRDSVLFKENKTANPNRHTQVIHSFYDENLFKADAERKDYALFAGRVTRSKGIEWAIEACRKANLPLKICGWKEDESLDLKGAEYMGTVRLSERNQLMAQAKVLLAPTLSFEPFGNVACEAQMCGTPVISTNWGGFVETVAHGYSGFRVSGVDEIVEAIGSLDKLKPYQDIRNRAVAMWSMRNLRHSYQKYFDQLSTLPC